MEYEQFFDREIKFDLFPKKLQCCTGEFEMASQDFIEDFKGNCDVLGRLILTNMRLIWFSKEDKRINLSIGMQNTKK